MPVRALLDLLLIPVLGASMLPVRLPLLMLLALVLAFRGNSQSGDTLNLDSPFAPPQTESAQQAQEASALEFRGFMQVGGQTFFNIVNSATKKSNWVQLNQSSFDFVVKGMEVTGDQEFVLVEHGGRVQRLALARPKTQKSAVSAIPGTGGGGKAQVAAAAQGPISPVVLNPSPADEARRMEDFVAEVRRRRLLRQQQPAGPTPTKGK